MSKYIIEAIGTFFLVLTIGLSANPLAIGVVLIAMIYMGGYISGAHYNPAVTLAVYLQKGIQAKVALIYVVVQLIAATVAAFVVGFLQHQPFVVQPGQGYDFISLLLAEVLFTFALCLVVLQTAVSKKNTPNQFYGLAIGFTVMAGAFSVGTISGGVFNPAVGIGPLLVNVASIGQYASNIGLYIVGPCVGALLASVIYSYTTKQKN